MQPRLPFEIEAQAADRASTLYFVRHRRARRYLVRVELNGCVRVTIPRGGSQRVAEAFVTRQRAWITRQLLRLPSRESVLTGEQRAGLRARAVAELPVELEALATRHGLEVGRVTVRDQKARWGSCGRNGHITLNWRLIAMPGWVREYVLLHELMHLKRLDHSPKYWALVAEACPNFAGARAWLRANGPSLA